MYFVVCLQITNRFTINLPGGQKAVMRISPQLTLEQVFARVCHDKSLDSRRYTLQHPSNPLQPLDLKATIAQSKLNEINLINAGGKLFLQVISYLFYKAISYQIYFTTPFITLLTRSNHWTSRPPSPRARSMKSTSSMLAVSYFYTSTKSWRGYIFTAVCVCVCVCLSVCLCVRISCEQNSSRKDVPIWTRFSLNGCLPH